MLTYQNVNVINFLHSLKILDLLGSHVCTANLNLVNNKKLKTFISKGLNHIPLEPLNPHMAIAALLECLADIAKNSNWSHLHTLGLQMQSKKYLWKKLKHYPMLGLRKTLTLLIMS